jgi:hypothetical protein
MKGALHLPSTFLDNSLSNTTGHFTQNWLELIPLETTNSLFQRAV